MFTTGYLVTWAAAGVFAFSGAWVVDSMWGDVLAWDQAGRWVAGGTLLLAAVYQLTPLKDVCLGKCRSPLGFILGSWARAGSAGFGWERRTVPGASAVAGRSWPRSLRWAS